MRAIPQQDAIDVFRNDDGDVVIQQTNPIGDDHFVYVAPCLIPNLLDAIRTVLADGPEVSRKESSSK